MIFELVLMNDGTVLDTADSPAALDYSLSYPYMRWCVIVRHISADGLATFTKVLASVNLTGSKDYRSNADYAVDEVSRELEAGHKAGEFDCLDFLSDWPVVDIFFEKGDDDD